MTVNWRPGAHGWRLTFSWRDLNSSMNVVVDLSDGARIGGNLCVKKRSE